MPKMLKCLKHLWIYIVCDLLGVYLRSASADAQIATHSGHGGSTCQSEVQSKWWPRAWSSLDQSWRPSYIQYLEVLKLHFWVKIPARGETWQPVWIAKRIVLLNEIYRITWVPKETRAKDIWLPIFRGSVLKAWLKWMFASGNTISIAFISIFTYVLCIT